MNKKIIGIIIVAVVCIGLVICGILLSENNANSNDTMTEETVPSETTSVSEKITDVSDIYDDNVVFETTVGFTTSAPDADRSNDTSENDNKIYVEDDENGMFSGGYFEWQ